MIPPTPTSGHGTAVPGSATAAPPDPLGSRPCHDPSGSGSVGRSASAALALIAVALLAHLIVAHNGPTWTSPLLIGDWLFSLILALAIPTYALALGRRIARPLLDPQANADQLGESLAALGLGLGALSLATLGLGLLRLYHGPLFLALWLALTLWLRPELRRIWHQAAHGTARWLRAGMPSAPTLPQRLALLVLLLTVPSVLLRTAFPVTEWDAVVYHLASLKIYLAANGIIPLPDLPPANEPSGAEMLLLPSLMAGADGVGKLFNPICALLMGLATYNLGRRYLGAATAWIGVLLFFSPLWLQLVLPLTLTDFASSLLGLLAVADAADWTHRTARPPDSDPLHDPSGSGRVESGRVESGRVESSRASSDRLLIRAGLFAGLSVSFKLTSAPAIPTLAITIGMASLLVCRGAPLARLLWAVRNGTLATVAAAIPLAPWLLKTRYFFGHFFYAVSVQVSNPSDGVIVASTAPSRLDHAHWVATTFWGLLWNHLGPLSLALLIAPLLLRRPEQRILLLYFLIGSILWLLLVPYYDPPRYFISLIALGAALIGGSLGAALTTLAALRPRPLPTAPATEHSAPSPPDPPGPDTIATLPDPSGSGPCHRVPTAVGALGSGRTGSGRTASGCLASGRTAPSGRDSTGSGRAAPQLLPLLLGGFLVLQALPGLFLGLRFFDDAQARAVATGRLSRHDYLAAHLPAYLALIYANDHLPTTARIALVNVVSGYYLDRPHLNEWYGTTLTALQAGDASRDAVRASWCQGRYTYLILDRADGSLDNNTRTGVHPRTTFTWLRMPGLAPRLLYTARAVDVYAIHPCR